MCDSPWGTVPRALFRGGDCSVGQSPAGSLLRLARPRGGSCPTLVHFVRKVNFCSFFVLERKFVWLSTTQDSKSRAWQTNDTFVAPGITCITHSANSRNIAQERQPMPGGILAFFFYSSAGTKSGSTWRGTPRVQEERSPRPRTRAIGDHGPRSEQRVYLKVASCSGWLIRKACDMCRKPLKWRRRESNPRSEVLQRRLLRV